MLCGYVYPSHIVMYNVSVVPSTYFPELSTPRGYADGGILKHPVAKGVVVSSALSLISDVSDTKHLK